MYRGRFPNRPYLRLVVPGCSCFRLRHGMRKRPSPPFSGCFLHGGVSPVLCRRERPPVLLGPWSSGRPGTRAGCRCGRRAARPSGAGATGRHGAGHERPSCSSWSTLHGAPSRRNPIRSPSTRVRCLTGPPRGQFAHCGACDGPLLLQALGRKAREVPLFRRRPRRKARSASRVVPSSPPRPPLSRRSRLRVEDSGRHSGRFPSSARREIDASSGARKGLGR